MIRSGAIGRIFVLLILIIILAFGGLLWFDYLGLMNTRSMFSGLFYAVGLKTPVGVAVSVNEKADLEADRYLKRLEALEIKASELDKLQAELDAQKKEYMQIAEELDDRRFSIEEKEKSFNQMLMETDDRNANIVQVAKYMNGMRPESAVANLLEMDDQDIIDVLRASENLSKKEGKASLVAYWFSLMPPARAAEIQRKMTNKPIIFQ